MSGQPKCVRVCGSGFVGFVATVWTVRVGFTFLWIRLCIKFINIFQTVTGTFWVLLLVITTLPALSMPCKAAWFVVAGVRNLPMLQCIYSGYILSHTLLILTSTQTWNSGNPCWLAWGCPRYTESCTDVTRTGKTLTIPQLLVTTWCLVISGAPCGQYLKHKRCQMSPSHSSLYPFTEGWDHTQYE